MPGRTKYSTRLSLNAFHQLYAPVQLNQCANMNQPNLEKNLQVTKNYQKEDDHEEEESKAKLPQMNAMLFAHTYLYPMQNLLRRLRAMHKKQADNASGKSELRCEEERMEFVTKKFHSLLKNHNFFCKKPLTELLSFIITSRVKTNEESFKYLSRPLNPRRFCPDSCYKKCKLREKLFWCDMKHAEDLERGDFISVQCKDCCECENNCSALVMYEPGHFCASTDAILIYQMQKPSIFNAKQSFFDKIHQSTKHLDISRWHSGRWHFHGTTLQDPKTRFVKSFTTLSLWCRYFYDLKECTFLTANTCKLLCSFGKKNVNFLILLLNGRLPAVVFRAFLTQKIAHDAQFTNHVRYLIRQTYMAVTCEVFSTWSEYYPQEVLWTFIEELCVQNIMCKGDEDENNKSTFSLHEVKCAMEIAGYLLGQNSNDGFSVKFVNKPVLTTKKVHRFVHIFEIYKIIIVFYLRQKSTVPEDLSRLDEEHTYKRWTMV